MARIALFVGGGSIKYMKFLMFTMDDPICKDQDRQLFGWLSLDED